MKILAIETSCDETALALVQISGNFDFKIKVEKSIVSSQIKIHQPFGGVVPSLAKREHLKNLPILFKKLMNGRKELPADFIAVTIGPGLEPALWTGINFAQELAKTFKKKIIGVNHLEAHYLSFLLNKKINIKNIFPATALIVSGGHTILLNAKSLTEYKKIGETRDDAAGEAFDKVARILGLVYPGGPEIEKLARLGNPQSINFPKPMLDQKNFDFSFSGLKTSVLYYWKNLSNKEKSQPQTINNIAASFQNAVIEVLTKKTLRAAWQFNSKSILISGGVASNKALRKHLARECSNLKINFLASPIKYNTDNAVMVAVAAYFSRSKKRKYRILAQPNLNL